MKKTFKKRYTKKRRNNKKTWKKRGGMFTARVVRAMNPYIEKKTKEFGQSLIEEKLKKTEQFKDIESNIEKTFGNISNNINNNKENQFNKPLFTPTSMFQSGINPYALSYAKYSAK